MPVIGPEYNKERAEEAFSDVLSLLANKYRILRFPVNEKMWGKEREDVKNDLKKAIHGVFRQDCFEGF